MSRLPPRTCLSNPTCHELAQLKQKADPCLSVPLIETKHVQIYKEQKPALMPVNKTPAMPDRGRQIASLRHAACSNHLEQSIPITSSLVHHIITLLSCPAWLKRRSGSAGNEGQAWLGVLVHVNFKSRCTFRCVLVEISAVKEDPGFATPHCGPRRSSRYRSAPF